MSDDAPKELGETEAPDGTNAESARDDGAPEAEPSQAGESVGLPTVDAAAAIAAEMTTQGTSEGDQVADAGLGDRAGDTQADDGVDIDIDIAASPPIDDGEVEFFADPCDDEALDAEAPRSVLPAQGDPAEDQLPQAAAGTTTANEDGAAEAATAAQAQTQAGAADASEGASVRGPSTLPTPTAARGGPVPVTDAGPAALKPLRVIAISGSRGGVGKTVLATNLALYLANIGRRVVLVDADSAGASVHTVLGTRMPTSLAHIRRTSRVDSAKVPDEALASTQFQGLQLLYAGVDEPAAAGSRGDRLTKLMERLRSIKAEYVLVDLGVGLSREVLDAYLMADQSLYVTLPEPSAIENTYRFLRGSFVRYLMGRQEVDAEERAELDRRFKTHGSALGPLELLDELEREHHPLRDKVRAAMHDFRPFVTINQTRLRADLQLGFAMESAARRRLGVRLEYVGHVDHDDTVWTCVRNRRPVLLDVPGAKSSKKIEKLARRLLMIQAGKDQRTRLPSVPQYSHHDMLELERGATDEEIRRAYKRTREIYAHDALCCYGLFEPNEIEKLRSRIDEAFDVLLDPARRRPYELSVFTDEPEPEASVVPEDDKDRPARPMPNLDPDTEFTGSLLRDVREARRVTLREISQRTKVGIPYLKAIETEDFGKLPAAVYTRGFVNELARFLKLDAQQVSRTYVQRYQAYLDNKQRNLLRGR